MAVAVYIDRIDCWHQTSISFLCRVFVCAAALAFHPEPAAGLIHCHRSNQVNETVNELDEWTEFRGRLSRHLRIFERRGRGAGLLLTRTAVLEGVSAATKARTVRPGAREARVPLAQSIHVAGTVIIAGHCEQREENKKTFAHPSSLLGRALDY